MEHKSSPTFADVRQQVPLELFFIKYLGDQGSKVAGRFTICPACGLTNAKNKVSVRNDFFKCFECGTKGDVIEAAAIAFGVDKNKAAIRLMSNRYLERELKQKLNTRKKDFQAIGKVATKLIDYQEKLSEPVITYLKKRGIGEGVIERGFAAGIIRSLPSENGTISFQYLKDLVGQDDLRSAGMLSGVKNFAAASYRPLIFLSQEAQAMEFRLIRERKEGDAKIIRYGQKAPFWLEQNNEQLIIVEGAIDLLSAMELGFQSSIIGLPGANSWELDWFQHWIGKRVLMALDNDDAGKAQTLLLGNKLKEMGCILHFYKHSSGKDLNEELQNKKFEKFNVGL